ncbi:MAG: four helix bundle protein [Patescibacteria group bacterium]|nr:four helix bundle protein [Patescibacteria group bacterium]
MEKYSDILKNKMDEYARGVYRVSKNFPRDEIYGLTSQLRRAALSVILNYIEGFARRTGDDCKTFVNFARISYGSLKESQYLLYFAHREKYLTDEEFKRLSAIADEIGAMLYTTINPGT